MFGVISALSWILASLFKSRKRLGAENLALRHQLYVLRRSAPRRARLRGWDRSLFVWLYRLWPGVLNSIVIVRPETVLRWHRAGFKAFWRWRSRGTSGRPRLLKEIRALIREVSLANPLWRAPRIHGELLKLGIDVAQSTVARYMVRGRRPPSQSTYLLWDCDRGGREPKVDHNRALQRLAGVAEADLFDSNPRRPQLQHLRGGPGDATTF